LRLDFPQNFLSGKFAWNGFEKTKILYKDSKMTQSFSEIALSYVNSYKDELKISFSSSSQSLGLVDYGKT